MSKPLILVVEDDFVIANDIKHVLSDNGYDVIANIQNVEKAKEKIQKYKPSLILLDIRLKGNEDGVDLGHFIVNTTQIPFLYLTSYADKHTLERAKKTRPKGFLVKPFKEIDLLSMVAVILNNDTYAKPVLPQENEVNLEAIPFRIREVIRYIEENCTKKIEIEDLVLLTSWKTHHFIRMFSTYVGTTPYNYILKVKIDKAKSLLISSNESITTIALELGFTSYSNFCKTFKNFNDNETPDTFRKRHTE